MTHCLDRRLFLKTTGSLAAAAWGTGVLRPLLLGSVPGASHAEKLGWRLGCCAYSFNDLTFYETIDKVAVPGAEAGGGLQLAETRPAESRRRIQ